MPEVLSFYELVTKKLAAEAEMAERWISDRHWGAVGASREAALRRFIVSYLPQRLVCGTGFILGQNGELSRQCDLLVYERDSLAPLFVEDDFVVVRADAVRLVIEAKSGVDKSVFSVAVNNIRAAKSLHPRIKGAVFGLSGPKTKKPILDWFRDLADNGVADSAGANGFSRVPAEHLVDFVHFASGLQVMAQLTDDRQQAVLTASLDDDSDGKALLRFWDWILRATWPDLLPGAREVPFLLEYLRLPEPEWPELMHYSAADI